MNFYRNLKEITLAAVTALGGTAVFVFWDQAMPAILGGEFENYSRFLLLILGLVLTAVFFGLCAFLVKNVFLFYGVPVFTGLVPFFTVNFSFVVFLSALASVFLFILAFRRIRKESILSFGFSTSKILSGGLGIFFTSASLIIATFFFTQLDEEKAVSTLLPKSTVYFVLQRMSGPISKALNIPEVKPDQTLDEVLEDVIREELKSQGILPNQISKAQFNQMLNEQRAQMAREYGVKVQGKEKVGDLIYQAIFARVKEMLGPYQKYLPYTSALIFLAAFKGITVPLFYFAVVISFFLIKLLIRIKILKKEMAAVEVERISL